MYEEDKCGQILFQYKVRSVNLISNARISSMNYWIVKTEPTSYSWEDFAKEKVATWDGVRNAQARLFLKQMQLGDQVLFYHSGKEKAVVGVAEVCKEGYPDLQNADWIAVDLAVKKKLNREVTLAQIKSEDRLLEMKMLRQSRLSVSPVQAEEFDLILKMS